MTDTADEARSFRVLGPEELDDVLRSMARRIAVVDGAPIKLVGIRRRGVPLAERIAGHLRELDRDASVGDLKLKRYDDDLHILHDRPALDEHPLPFDVEGARVVVVDDVRYSGHTLMRAVAHLVEQGAGTVECAVLCSRGSPNVPVATAIVGTSFDVPSGMAVEVGVPPYEDEEGVWLRRVDT